MHPHIKICFLFPCAKVLFMLKMNGIICVVGNKTMLDNFLYLAAIITILLAVIIIILLYVNLKSKKHIISLQSNLQQEQNNEFAQKQLYENISSQIKDSFAAISHSSLAQNNKLFFDLAKNTFDNFASKNQMFWEEKQKEMHHCLNPIQKSLDKFETQVTQLEKDRVSSYSALFNQVQSLTKSQTNLQQSTERLNASLNSSSTRGKWGEIQLRRVVELAGLNQHCDFSLQEVLQGEDGNILRPDMVIKLPNKHTIIVDAKTPLHYYLKANDEENEEQKTKLLKTFAENVRAQIKNLSSKQYWQFCQDQSAEFVVMFLPNELFLHVALEHCPDILEFGINKKVILTTPCTLIALLQVVAFGWRQEALSQNVKDLEKLGHTMHKRLLDLSKHLNSMGGNLNNAVKSYNSLVGSFSSRVLTAAKRLSSFTVAGKDNDNIQLTEIDTITTSNLSTSKSPQQQENPKQTGTE